MVSIYFILRIINSVVISKKVCKKYINYNNRLYYTAFVGGENSLLGNIPIDIVRILSAIIYIVFGYLCDPSIIKSNFTKNIFDRINMQWYFKALATIGLGIFLVDDKI